MIHHHNNHNQIGTNQPNQRPATTRSTTQLAQSTTTTSHNQIGTHQPDHHNWIREKKKIWESEMREVWEEREEKNKKSSIASEIFFWQHF